jgi:hypothetical protein
MPPGGNDVEKNVRRWNGCHFVALSEVGLCIYARVPSNSFAEGSSRCFARKDAGAKSQGDMQDPDSLVVNYLNLLSNGCIGNRGKLNGVLSGFS